MSSERSIGACTPADYAAVTDLVNAAYRGQGGQNGWTHEIGLVDGLRITPDRLRGTLSGEGEPIIYLLREAGVLRACVHLESSRGRAEPACHISMLAVRPGLQDHGLGRLMLDYAEAQGRARGAQLARMTVVSVRHSLIAWYERRGYRRTGETLPFPYDDGQFGTPQRPDLEFVVLEKRLQT
jgi:ribosomal protein S18 acetylase RimI-like enzyme